MPDPGVTQLLYLLDQSFDGNDEHSLLGNLRNLEGSDAWSGLPASGGRTIRQIADHAGVALRLYANHLFGDATSTYMDVQQTSPSRKDPSTIPATIEWLHAGHAELRHGLCALSDADLLVARRSHWGQMAEARWLIATVIQHNVYHAGEINHLRALLQGNDHWPGLAPAEQR